MDLEIEDVIKVLEESLDTELFLDGKQCCNILINDQITIQIELDKNHHAIILGSPIFELPPGKFKEIVLKNALKSNFGREKEIGILAFVPKSSVLYLYDFLPLNFLASDQIYHFFLQFIQKAMLWKESLQNNRTPYSSIPSSGGIMFGLR